MIQKNKKKQNLILDLLNDKDFRHINNKLTKVNINLNKIRKQINNGKRILTNIRPLRQSKESRNINSIYNSGYSRNKDPNLDDEYRLIKNRLNIYNYKIYSLPHKETENDNKNNISHYFADENIIIKSLLGKLSIENKNKMIQQKLKSIESQDCSKRKKIKLKPLINSHLLNNSLSHSNKYIFPRKNNINDHNNNNNYIHNFFDNQNTSTISSLFKNTTINVIKNRGGELDENQFYSPVLRRNMLDEFQMLDNEQNESIETSHLIKEGIKDMNENKYKKPLYLSEKRDKRLITLDNNTRKKFAENNVYTDITKIRTIKALDKYLFQKKKNNPIFKNIKLRDADNNLKTNEDKDEDEEEDVESKNTDNHINENDIEE